MRPRVKLNFGRLHMKLQIQRNHVNGHWEISGKEEKNELKIAEAFNDYFVNKIAKLKEGIDQALVVDPQEKLKIQWDLNTKLVWYSNGWKEVGCQMVRFSNAIWLLDSPTIWIPYRWMPSCFIMYWSGIQMFGLIYST